MTTVTLTKPVAIGPAIYDSLTFRPIRLGDYPAMIKAMQLTDVDDILDLVARLSDVPRAVIDAIAPADATPLLEAASQHIAAHSNR